MRTSVLITVLASLLTAVPANATVCVGWPTPCQAYDEAAAVFIGTVVAVERIDAARAATLAPPVVASERMASTTVFPVQWVARLRIEQAIKGMREREVELATDYVDAYRVGQRWLIYAARESRSGGLSVIGCGRSTLLEQAGDDVRYLKQIRAVSRSNRLAGTVARYDTIPGDDTPVVEALSNIRVTVIDTRGSQRELLTSDDGVYEWLGLPPGPYRIHADVPRHLSLFDWTRNDRTVEVTAGTCTTADFTAQSTGSISGRVSDEVGRGVQILVSVIRAERADVLGTPLARRVLDISNGMGYYSIEGLPPGRYLVGVNLDSGVEPDAMYPSTFHPHGSLDEAVVVTLGEAEQVSGINITLRPRAVRR